MIAVIATIRLQADKVEQFESVSRTLELAVREHEPGCVMYRMAKSRDDALIYKSIELFRDQAALDQHVAADYFLAALAPLRACVAEPSVVEFLDTLED